MDHSGHTAILEYAYAHEQHRQIWGTRGNCPSLHYHMQRMAQFARELGQESLAAHWEQQRAVKLAEYNEWYGARKG